MQKLLFLHVVDHNPDSRKMLARDDFAAAKAARQDSYGRFRKALSVSPFAKTTRIARESEVSPEMIVEFPDGQNDAFTEWLRTVDVVETIDTHIYRTGEKPC